MPCSKAMRSCRRDCLHRKLVLEYRDARDAYEAVVEREAIGYATEERDYKRDHPGPTFKAWLQGTAGARQNPEE